MFVVSHLFIPQLTIVCSINQANMFYQINHISLHKYIIYHNNTSFHYTFKIISNWDTYTYRCLMCLKYLLCDSVFVVFVVYKRKKITAHATSVKHKPLTPPNDHPSVRTMNDHTHCGIYGHVLAYVVATYDTIIKVYKIKEL